mmetsp:Transcript_25347/g.74423  ORF Transcript_25347/g.74423 Transcript_25347/m.74423 type:complete len:348 (-) Transcript_25347:395-1438(-)
MPRGGSKLQRTITSRCRRPLAREVEVEGALVDHRAVGGRVVGRARRTESSSARECELPLRGGHEDRGGDGRRVRRRAEGAPPGPVRCGVRVVGSGSGRVRRCARAALKGLAETVRLTRLEGRRRPRLAPPGVGVLRRGRAVIVARARSALAMGRRRRRHCAHTRRANDAVSPRHSEFVLLRGPPAEGVARARAGHARAECGGGEHAVVPRVQGVRRRLHLVFSRTGPEVARGALGSEARVCRGEDRARPPGVGDAGVGAHVPRGHGRGVGLCPRFGLVPVAANVVRAGPGRLRVCFLWAQRATARAGAERARDRAHVAARGLPTVCLVISRAGPAAHPQGRALALGL